MDSNQLKCFVSVAHSLNFTEAARQNHVTQPAFSRTIKDLEESVGATLLFRTKHSVMLTVEGREFLDYAEKELENERNIRARLENLTHSYSGNLKIALIGDSTDEFLACISEFNSIYPNVQYIVSRCSGSELASLLSDKSQDFYFATSSSFSTVHNFSYIQTYQENFCLVVHKTIANMIDPNDISTFEQLPFATIDRTLAPIYYDRIMSFCSDMGYHPKVTSYYNSAEATMLAPASGVGITIVTESAARYTLSDNIVCLPFDRDIPQFMHAIGWRNDSLHPTSRKFLDVIKSRYPEDTFPIIKI